MQDFIDALRQQLVQHGSIVSTDPDGRKLFIVSSRQLSIEENGLLLAYEGEGAMFFTMDRPLNEFRLLSAGFSAYIAPSLAATVNAILGMDKPTASDTIIQLLPYHPE